MKGKRHDWQVEAIPRVKSIKEVSEEEHEIKKLYKKRRPPIASITAPLEKRGLI
jgi:hypothetical protein